MPAQEQQQACMESKKSHGRNPSHHHHHHHHHPFALLSFFKVMIGDFSQALFLPPIVAKRLSSLLDMNVDIEDSTGRRWGVKISLVDNHLAFEEGWQDFVLDHSIKVGEFVVINHVDRLLFSAKIYAITGCERLEFFEKSISSKSKRIRKNEASADDLSLKKCQSVRKLDKDVVDSNERSIKKKQTKKSAPGDTSDSRMVTRSRTAGVKRKGGDVDALKTSPVHRESSKRPQIEIVEPVVLLDEMVDKTCQISPAGPVNMDVDVMTMTDGDNSNNVGDSVSEGMSRDFVMEEQMPNVPVKVAPQDSVFMKGNIRVSSPDMIASEAKGKSCNAVEIDTLVTNEKSSHGSLSETEADCVVIVDPLIRNSVLTRDSPQGVVAVSSLNSIASKAKGNLCSAIEADTLVINEELSPHHCLVPVECQPLLTSESDGHGSQNENVIVDPLISDGVLKGESPQENVAVSSVNSIHKEAIGNSCIVQQTTDGLVMNEERECTGHGLQNETEVNCEIIVDPLISDKVMTGDFPQGTSTAEGIEIKLEGGKSDSSESFDDDDVTERNLMQSGGVYKLLGTLQGICYIIGEDFTDKFYDGIVYPIDLCGADEADFLHKTDGTFNEDKSRHISPSVPLNKVPQNEEVLGFLGEDKVLINRSKSVPCRETPEFQNVVNVVKETVPRSGKMPVVLPEENEKKLNPCSETTAREDVQTECLMIGKKPIELLEENEKKSSVSPEVTIHEDLKPEFMDLMEVSSSRSTIFKFCLPSNNNAWLNLSKCIPYSFGKMFLLRKVVVLQDPVMRKWPVLYCESRRFTGFIGGWKDFTAANDLKAGDMCELHLADKENHTFLVRITKAEEPSP